LPRKRDSHNRWLVLPLEGGSFIFFSLEILEAIDTLLDLLLLLLAFFSELSELVFLRDTETIGEIDLNFLICCLSFAQFLLSFFLRSGLENFAVK
jgi:hypothetical protein